MSYFFVVSKKKKKRRWKKFFTFFMLHNKENFSELLFRILIRRKKTFFFWTNISLSFANFNQIILFKKTKEYRIKNTSRFSSRNYTSVCLRDIFGWSTYSLSYSLLHFFFSYFAAIYYFSVILWWPSAKKLVFRNFQCSLSCWTTFPSEEVQMMYESYRKLYILTHSTTRCD